MGMPAEASEGDPQSRIRWCGPGPVSRLRQGQGNGWRSEHDQPQPYSLDDRLAPALDSQFAENGVDVELGRVLADAEPLGDLLVGETLSEELQDLQLPRRQG